MTCKEIGDWFTDNIEKPLEQWRINAIQQCTEAKRWLEEIRTQIENWWRSQATRCQEQPCNWWCLCCNKWFCWIIDIIVRIITLIIQIIEHVIEAICTLIITLIWLIISIIVQVIKWVVLAIVCILEALCALMILIGALAVLVLLLSIVAIVVPILAPIVTPLIPIAAVVAVVALALAKLLCEASRCRVLGAIGWAMKWAIVLGAVIAVIFLSPLSAWVVALFGGLISALSIAIEKIPCTLPRMLALP